MAMVRGFCLCLTRAVWLVEVVALSLRGRSFGGIVDHQRCQRTPGGLVFVQYVHHCFAGQHAAQKLYPCSKVVHMEVSACSNANTHGKRGLTLPILPADGRIQSSSCQGISPDAQYTDDVETVRHDSE